MTYIRSLTVTVELDTNASTQTKTFDLVGENAAEPEDVLAYIQELLDTYEQ